MTLTQQVIALVTMAVAIMTILTVGTLAAADILPLRRRKAAAPASRAASPPERPSGE